MDPDLEMQGLIVQTLKADPAIVALVGPRVYDTIPDNPVFPYVSYGPVDTLQDDADCIGTQNLFIQLDAWSRAVGYPEVKKIADAVRDALHDKDLALTINALVVLQHRQTRTLRDPDGLTSHSAISLEAFVERRPAPVFP
jgi:hypothetical protein